MTQQELELPKGWVDTNLLRIAQQEKNSIVDGPFGSNLKVSDYSPSGTIPVLTISILYDISQIHQARKITEKKFEEIGKNMKRKHSKNDIIVFSKNDNFLLSPLAQVLHIHQYFLNNFIRKKGAYCISKLK